MHHFLVFVLKTQNQYIVHFGGLKEGLHRVDFTMQKEFFDEFTSLEALGGNLQARIGVLKASTFLTFDIVLTGTLDLRCDRCLETYSQEIRFKGNLIVKFSVEKNQSGDPDEILYLSPEEQEIDLKHYLFESISLSIPYKRIHPDVDGITACNTDMLKYITDHQYEKQRDTNPIWDKLRDYLQTQ